MANYEQLEVETPTVKVSKNTSRVGWAIVALLAVNAVIASVLLVEMRATKHEVVRTRQVSERLEPKANKLFATGQKITNLVDSTSQLFYGSIPNLANKIVRKDFGNFGSTLAGFATSVRTALTTAAQNAPADYKDMFDQVATIADAIRSISTRISRVGQVTDPASQPYEQDNGEILDVADYALSFTLMQTSIEDWKNLASTCLLFASAVESINWSGQYVNAYGDIQYWDVNPSFNFYVPRIQAWCQAITQLSASAEVSQI